MAKEQRLLSTDIHADLKTVERVTKEIVTIDEDGPSIDTRNLERAANTLGVLRETARVLDKDYKERVKSLVDQIHPFDVERQTIKAHLDKAERDLEGALLKAYDDKDISDEGISASLCRLSVVKKEFAKVDDASKVPDEYILPRAKCLDVAKIDAALKAGAEIPGVSKCKKISFRAALKEQIEV